MKGVMKMAKEANGRSRKCAICQMRKRYKICPPEVQRICSDAFVEGFKKGVKTAENKLKMIENETRN